MAKGLGAGEFVEDVLGNALDTLQGSTTIVYDMLVAGKKSGSIGEITSELIGITTKVIEGLTAVGLSIVAVFFLISLIELAMQDRMTIEMFIKHFSKAAIGVAVVSASSQLFTGITAFGTELSTTVQGVLGPNNVGNWSSGLTGVAKEINKANPSVFDQIGVYASVIGTIVPLYLVCLAITVVTYMIAFTRLIELCARGCFLPIAAGLMADDGWRGSGGRYIKKLIAVCSQVAVLIVISTISATILAKIADGVVDGLKKNYSDITNLLYLIGAGLAMVSAMFKSMGIVNDVFGA